MGAGSITSNVKSDKKLVVVKTEEGNIETGMKNFGAMVGDEVEVLSLIHIFCIVNSMQHIQIW